MIAAEYASARKTDPATDLVARASPDGLGRDAGRRDVWLASGGARDPRILVNDAFDLVEEGLAG